MEKTADGEAGLPLAKPSAQGLSAGGRCLIIRKPSWCGQEQFLRHAPLDADHFSHAECWMALKFSGIPQLYSFRAGKLQDAEVEVPCPDFLPSSVESMQEMEVELVAIWLDLASAYRPGERMHREDLTIALQRISVSISSADGTGNLDIVLFTHVFDMFTSQVWDARNVIVLDARPGCPAGLPVPQLHCIGMHNFTLSGKTKYWEVKWNSLSHVYPDKNIGNRFDANGNWVGDGKGCNGGIYRHYGGSGRIEEALERFLQ